MEIEVDKKQSLAITKLYNAALMGDVSSFLSVLEEDDLILDRCVFEKSCRYVQSPLHVAASKGHVEIVKIILSRKPNLCFLRDQDGMNPIHVAASNGHVEIVKTMLSQKPNLCFLRDQDGMNPIHVASIEGHVDVLRVLYEMNSHAARERTNGGSDTILHLCVKHNHFEALMLLLDLTNDGELLNSKDNNGNTVLHLAVTGKQVEMVKLILEQPRMKKNAINNNGLTAVDCLPRTESKKDAMCNSEERKLDSFDDEIRVSLLTAKTLRAKDVLKIQKKSCVESQSQALMVVASLIATMAFQVVLSPPGGFWQDTNIKCQNNNVDATVDYISTCHAAGAPIAGDYYPWLFNQLVIWNTVALVSALIVILLLISGLPSGKYFVEIFRITMWISVTATIATYSLSLAAIYWSYDPHENSGNGLLLSNDPINTVWKIVVAIMLFGRLLHFLVYFIKKRPSMQSRFINRLTSTSTITCPPSCLQA